MAEGCQRKRKGEKKTPLSYRERTRSSTAWHQDIRDFDRAARSTTAQSLFVSYPLLLLLLGSDMHLPPPPSLLPSLQLAHLSSSLLSSLRVHLDPSGAHPPLPIPSPSSSRSVFVSSLSLLRYRVPISGPLGFTWRALMTSRNERVPPPSNKRLFHVPMLILRESSRLQLPLHHLLHHRHLIFRFSFLRTSRCIRCVHIYEIKMREKKNICIYQ